MTDQFNWYWTSPDNRIYSSAINALVDADDVGYQQFLEWRGGVPTPWPLDAEGNQTISSVLVNMTVGAEGPT